MLNLTKKILGFSLFTLASVATAKTVTFQNGQNGYTGCSDTYLVMNNDNIQGSKSLLVIEGYHCLRCIDRRTMIRFDLSSLPKDTKVNSAKLSLYAFDQPRAGGTTIDVFEILDPWEESETSWYNATSQKEWQMGSGGSFSSVATTSYDYSSDLNVWHDIDVTNAVQKAVANPSENFGILLKMIATMKTVRYESSQSPNLEHRPKLVLDIESETSVKETKGIAQKAFTFLVQAGKLTLQSEISGLKEFQISSLSGKTLLSGVISANQQSLDISAIPAGVYLISLRFSTNAMTQKLAITK